jgi:hypothetical protein
MEVEIDTLLQCGLGELVAGFWRDARGKYPSMPLRAPWFSWMRHLVWQSKVFYRRGIVSISYANAVSLIERRDGGRD